MAWPVTVKSPDEMFKPATQVAQHKTGLKVLIYGREETWKTSFALSFPEPVYIFDTELGAPPLFRYFPKKDIRWCDATFLNPTTGLHDAMLCLQQLEAGIALLKDIGKDRKPDDPPAGTVVIDSGTDVILSAHIRNALIGRQWDWIQEWLNEVGKHKEGQLLRFEWAKAKLKWKKLLLQLMAKSTILSAYCSQSLSIWSIYGDHEVKIVQCEQCRWWYLAGIIDGEGTITLALSEYENRANVQPFITISNRDVEWLEMLSELYPQFRKPTSGHGAYKITCTRQEDVKYILEHVLPKLFVKREVAEKVLQYLKLRESHKWEPKTSEEKELVRQIVLLSSAKDDVTARRLRRLEKL